METLHSILNFSKKMKKRLTVSIFAEGECNTI